MVTESIFHNFVVNDAEGAERIAEALSAWTEQYLECVLQRKNESKWKMSLVRHYQKMAQ